MDKKNRISIKLDNTWNKPRDNVGWTEEEESFRSPTIPFSHFQKRQRKQSWINERKKIDTPSHKKKYGRLKSSSKLFFTIGSAVGLGLVMGMMVLNIFSSLNEKSSSLSVEGNRNPIENREGVQVPSTLQEEPPLLIPSGNIEGKSVQLPSRSYYVVQAGAFSDKTMAGEGLSNQRQQGWAGLLLGESPPYRLYVGISSSREEAMLLGQFYREKNMEIYVKDHQIAQVSGAVVEISEEALNYLPSFITKGDQLLTKMGQISARGIMNPSSSFNEEEWKQLQEQHRSFLQEGQVLFAEWEGNGGQTGQRMIHQITEGMNALEIYQKQKHVSYLWKVQQASLQYIEAYEQFIILLPS